MDNIILRSGTLKVIQITRKTKAILFKDLKIGDEVEFSVPIKQAGSNRGTTYSTYIKTKNLTTGAATTNSFNQLPPLLEAFVFEQF